MILPLTIMGPALVCAATLVMCLSSLVVLSSAFRAENPHYEESQRLSAQLLFWRDELQLEATGSLGRSAPQPRPRGIQTIRFDVPALSPMAFTQFCLKYPDECRPQPLPFEADRMKLNVRRWAELENINRSVNAAILPERNRGGLGSEKWLISPASGDCNDYAVTKRHQLIAMGWPAGDVLLSEVVTITSEHHLVAVVRSDSGDLVLDNLTDQIVPWFQTRYRWLRIQTPKNPTYWASVSDQNI